MIKCPECNRKNLDKAKFCEKCGAPIQGKTDKQTAPMARGKRVIASAKTKTAGPPKVIITDIKIPFWSMVIFMVKWVFASIPAIIIVALLVFLCISIASGLGNFVKILVEKLGFLL